MYKRQALKDPDYGIYPMVTSSSTLAGYGAIGAGLPPYAIEDIVVVVKAYSSAVGAGAFVSEIFGDEAQEMRVRGGDAGEFGATTGRPRRIDVYKRQALFMQAIAELAHRGFHVGEDHDPVIVHLVNNPGHVLQPAGTGGHQAVLVNLGTVVPFRGHRDFYSVVLVLSLIHI